MGLGMMKRGPRRSILIPRLVRARGLRLDAREAPVDESMPTDSRAARSGRFRHGALPVIGLIGGIGGGKSEVAALLKERGAVVIDADAVGHELLNDPGVRDQIVERFGAGVLAGAGGEPDQPPAIDRKALGAIVFADPEARRDLEAILHPADAGLVSRGDRA